MRGIILSQSDAGGVISADDGSRYIFDGAAWMADRPAHMGDIVDFIASGSTASNIYPLAKRPPAVDMAGTLNPLRKIYKFCGISLIVLGSLLTLTVIFSFLGIPLLIFGLLLVFVAPKFVGNVERSAGVAIDRVKDSTIRLP